jgi:hypothetical protein
VVALLVTGTSVTQTFARLISSPSSRQSGIRSRSARQKQ